MGGVFINTKGANPVPYFIYDDVGETKRQLIELADTLAPDLSTFFDNAHLPNRNRTLSAESHKYAQTLLGELLQQLRKSPLATPDRVAETFSKTEHQILSGILSEEVAAISEGEIGGFLDKVANGVAELSIANKGELWGQIHNMYEACGLHKGDLYFNEAHDMIGE